MNLSNWKDGITINCVGEDFRKLEILPWILSLHEKGVEIYLREEASLSGKHGQLIIRIPAETYKPMQALFF